MPFTVNVGPYVGGQLWAQGLQNAGNNIAEGITKAVQEYHKTQEEQGADDIILNFARQNGMVTPQMEADYIKGSHSAKNGIIVGLTRQFAMSQKQKEDDAQEKDRQARLAIAQQHLELARQGAKTIPFKVGDQTFNIPENEAARLAASQESHPEDDTIEDVTPDGKTYKVSIRSAYGQKLLEQKDPRKALMWQYGKEPEEMYDDNQIKAGTVDQQTGAFKPAKLQDATHIQVGGDSVMPKEKFYYFKRRLDKAGLGPKAAEATPEAAPEKGSGSGGKTLSTQDKQALDWATANPNDPRAAAIKARLGVK